MLVLREVSGKTTVRNKPRRRSRARRTLAAATVLSCVAALLGLSVPASAGPEGHSAQTRAVVSGDARFEVLSPTLVRMEYAGDAAFTDAPTFNAIGRDGFGNTPFTSTVADGWLTIRTSAVTVRYKVGSGPFTPQNVSVQLRSGRQLVTARPTWPSSVPTCETGTLCEAEDAALTGASVANDHQGYTGSGFAAGFETTGASLRYAVGVTTAGAYQFRVRYANARGGDGLSVTRTLSLSVDAGPATTLTLPVTGSWDSWALASADLNLSAGAHTLSVSRNANDSGHVNIDSLAVTAPGAAYPAPASTTMTCAYQSVCEAEAGVLAGGASKGSDHNGYSGSGFTAGLEQTSATDTVTVTGVPSAGSYALQLRYANWQSTGPAVPRAVSVGVGGAAPSTVTLAPTSSWDSWRTVAVPVSLAAGDNAVTIGCPSADSCHLNLDTVAVAPTSAPLLAPHAPLGGYRRGLDGVNGSAPATPGLLYQDGWYLLDDTASAVFNDATHTVTQRPSHNGLPYQDGYLFGYGQDYQQGLRDLATLTGPSKLLPRWAYGVWYSKYYDYTAADYQNTILPKFRSEGVPLDVLVTDTDYKSPDRWDGWEIDSTRFPDPKAFFDWAASQGLHNTLNIHPSIVSNDPQFPAAQATAHGALTQNNASCYSDLGHSGDCYVFDWADPNQLKAYFDLHQTMEQQGVDFWWLDWCCEQSKSTLAGITPDAWINQMYADDTAKNIGRGFAFSRAFGSLQSGGYSSPTAVTTGPWADKRTTVHFTGDTTSSWDTLKYEVWYTPAEAASTGLSATSHDLGGFNGPSQLPDDLYVRWVQLGAFQPIFRLHGNHSNRLPWEYSDPARTAAEKFMNLRENLVPYTYTLAEQTNRTGVPIVRPTYLEYPDQQDAYAAAGSEYFYGPDVLVAPVTTAGTTATTSVWFPPGQWTDYFTGKTYTGPSTQDITTDWTSMPVFLKAGAIVPTRSTDVTNDVQNPLTQVTLHVAEGANGSYSLYEDNGTSTTPGQSATTAIGYTKVGPQHLLGIAPTQGSFAGQVTQRSWTVVFDNATPPSTVTVNGVPARSTNWTWDAASRQLTVRVPARSVREATVVAYH
jgi:hypothetical protein